MNFWIYCVAAHCFCQQEVLSEMFSRGRWDSRLSKMNIKLPELEDSLPTPMMISNSQMIKKAQGILWDRRVFCRLFQTFKGHAYIVHRQHALERRDRYYCQLNGLWLHGHLHHLSPASFHISYIPVCCPIPQRNLIVRKYMPRDSYPRQLLFKYDGEVGVDDSVVSERPCACNGMFWKSFESRTSLEHTAQSAWQALSRSPA